MRAVESHRNAWESARRPRRRGAGGLRLAGLALLGVALQAAGAGGEAPVSLQAEGAAEPAPRSHLEVARRPEPYLALDLQAAGLRLMHGGAILREYPVAAVELGGAVVMFVDRDTALPARGEVRTLERVAPPRACMPPAVYEPAPGEPIPAAAIPPEPEEVCPAPDGYVLIFDGGLAIEIRGGPDEGSGSGAARALGRRIRDFGAALGRRPELRLRLRLEGADAGALYRSLPMATRLVIL